MLMDISAIILVFNEEMHIKRCLESVKPWVQSVFAVDCFSEDRTVEIAKELGAQVFQNKWEGAQSIQFNWALGNLPIKTEWVLRLDADEYVCPELVEEIKAKLDTLPCDVTGVVFNLRRIFMGRHIRHGMPKVKSLRLFRYGKARCEQKLMDEHIALLAGRTVEFNGDFADHNLNDIGWWTAKHNGYAIREAADLLLCSYYEGNERVLLGAQTADKREKKARYARLPLFLRAFAYFCYRYFLRAGFLDGKEGFLWHFLQGWWYRTLVDVKVSELTRESGGDQEKLLSLLREKYGMAIPFTG